MGIALVLFGVSFWGIALLGVGRAFGETFFELALSLTQIPSDLR